MKFKVYTYIEVEGLEHCWAVELDDCKPEMKPIVPKYVFVHNEVGTEIIHVDNLLCDTKPERIIKGVTGEICDSYIEVGFWKPKQLTQN